MEKDKTDNYVRYRMRTGFKGMHTAFAYVCIPAYICIPAYRNAYVCRYRMRTGLRSGTG